MILSDGSELGHTYTPLSSSLLRYSTLLSPVIITNRHRQLINSLYFSSAQTDTTEQTKQPSHFFLTPLSTQQTTNGHHAPRPRPCPRPLALVRSAGAYDDQQRPAASAGGGFRSLPPHIIDGSPRRVPRRRLSPVRDVRGERYEAVGRFGGSLLR